MRVTEKRDDKKDEQSRAAPVRAVASLQSAATLPAPAREPNLGGSAAHEASRAARERAALPTVPQPKALQWANVGAYQDPAEHEADRVAEQVTTSGVAPPINEAAGAQPAREPGGAAGVSGAAAPSGDFAPPADGGAPLPPAARNFFEPRFGRDFGDVRVHTGADAARSARTIDARAFTTGRDVVFGDGEFQPESADGRTLIAHELTHVVQQEGGAAGPIRRAPARDPSAPPTGKSVRWPEDSPTTVRVAPLAYGSGAQGDFARARVATFLGPGATVNALAADLLPIYSMATSSGAGSAAPPTALQLAEAIVEFNAHIFYATKPPVLTVGQRLPLPIEVDDATGDWIVSADLERARAGRFEAAKRDPALLAQTPAAPVAPTATGLDAQVTTFLATNKNDFARGVALQVQLIDNAVTGAPFALKLFDKLGDGAIDVILGMFDNIVRWQLQLLSTLVPGRAALRRMQAILSSPPATLTADKELKRKNALRNFPREETVAPLTPDFVIESALGGSATPANVIFFGRGRALLDPVADAAQLKKLKDLAKTNVSKAVTLNGSVSEDEAADLADARAATVAAILKRERDAAAGTSTSITDVQAAPKNATGQSIGANKADYSSSRSVEVVASGQVTAQVACGAITNEPCTGPKYTQREANFKAADTRARELLTLAIDSVKDSKKKAVMQSMADGSFGTGTDLAKVLERLNAIKAEYAIAAASHRCDNGCDAQCNTATAHCGGVGSSAELVLCRKMDAAGGDTDAAVLIHETTHATPGFPDAAHGTGDFSYVWERLFTVQPTVDPMHAWRNADAWTWFIMGMRAGGSPDKPVNAGAADDVTGLASGQDVPARIGLALATKWLGWVNDYVSFAYQQSAQRTPTGKSWSGVYEPTVAAAAADFGVTAPKTGATFNKPTPQDQMKMAAVNQRFVSMWTDVNQTVKFQVGAAGSAGSWVVGSPSVLTLPPTYFSLSGDALGLAVVSIVVAGRADISPGLRAKYVDFVSRILAAYRIDHP